MPQHDPSSYSPAFAELLAQPRVMVLDQGAPNHQAKPLLEALTLNSAFGDHPIADRDMAAACLSAVWLYHDFHDRSHALSQDIHSTTGSYWHGIMHRREPDYWNSKYWFAKVGQHPIFPDLAAAANQAADEANLSDAIASVTSRGQWDAAAFVDLCEQAASEKGALETLCQEIQSLEWWLLFDYSYNHAIGK